MHVTVCLWCNEYSILNRWILCNAHRIQWSARVFWMLCIPIVFMCYTSFVVSCIPIQLCFRIVLCIFNGHIANLSLVCKHNVLCPIHSCSQITSSTQCRQRIPMLRCCTQSHTFLFPLLLCALNYDFTYVYILGAHTYVFNVLYGRSGTHCCYIPEEYYLSCR